MAEKSAEKFTEIVKNKNTYIGMAVGGALTAVAILVAEKIVGKKNQ